MIKVPCRCLFSTKKIGVFLKKQCYDEFFAKTRSSLRKIRHFLAKILLKNTYVEKSHFAPLPLNATRLRDNDYQDT
jgi:hypothetical protein